MRGLVPVEVAAIIAVAAAPWPETLPVALPLIVVATIARLVRGHSWGELMKRGGVLVATIAGLAALGIAVALGTPLVEQLTGRGVEWSRFPVVRGSAGQLIAVLLVVGATTIAAELALRGWIVERVLELSRAPAVIAILVGGFAEALLVDGDLTARLGGAAFGCGLGWLYVASAPPAEREAPPDGGAVRASGRNLAVPVCARLAFQLGAVVLEWLKLVG